MWLEEKGVVDMKVLSRRDGGASGNGEGAGPKATDGVGAPGNGRGQGKKAGLSGEGGAWGGTRGGVGLAGAWKDLGK